MGISDEYNTCSEGLKAFRIFNSNLSEREVIPALLSCTRGQMKLGESVIEALLAAAPGRLIPLTYPAFITFFAQVRVLLVFIDVNLSRVEFAFVLHTIVV